MTQALLLLIALLPFVACAHEPLRLDQGDENVAKAAAAWNDACGTAIVMKPTDRTSSRVFYVHDPSVCKGDQDAGIPGRAGEGVAGGPMLIFGCGQDVYATQLHEIGHLLGIGAMATCWACQHHHGTGVMSDTRNTGKVTRDDLAFLASETGIVCPKAKDAPLE